MTAITGSATGCSDLIAMTVSGSHGSPVATATVETISHTLELGDDFSIVMGGGQVFNGYVKQIEHLVSPDRYAITAYDKLIRAQDFFIASTDPRDPFKRSNISAENLAQDIFNLAGLSISYIDATSFTFGVNAPVEVNLVSSYDYVKSICDLLTWSVWADKSGAIHFENRKPFPMTGGSGQPGDSPDSPIGYTLSDDKALALAYSKTEKDLRNRIVVYGSGDVFAEAKAASPYLPSGFYKTAVLSGGDMIDTTSMAQKTADYNLNLMNKLTEVITATVIGNPLLEPRKCITVSSSLLGISGTWYVYTAEHEWGRTGYTTNIMLRK